MKEIKSGKKQKEIEPIITFLRETKQGKYAKVEESSLKHTRIKEETIVVKEEYYYSIR